MESSVDLEKRVSILEVEMNWATGTVQEIKKDLDILKNSQFQILERLMEYKADTDARMYALHAHTDERISSLQAHMDERFSHQDEKFIAVHAEFADKFIGVHAEFAGVHKEIVGIHKAISGQTKWLLTMMLASAAVISVLHPLVQKLLQ
jgi:hypothetical protein